ncbi:MAG: GlxA family transcriptional regulator [Geminicoccaceae bacterium]|jgi:transcriptional regulator GlxA family with amidase domain|nr:GlxA family transcriptional regulator [Geminicoccaceae bacterium]MCB9966434.1 GlxA family transcriptional regulator [Geminicoccaceae bacterium]HRY24071.1 GlxA family transcriptional regulator [Geminicoccaceae bacterium]
MQVVTAAGAAVDTETVAFFLVPDFSMISFASAVEPLRIANRLSGRSLYRWLLLSKDGGPVRGSNGISVNVDMAMDRIQASFGQSLPTICLASGLHGERYADKDVFAWLRRMDRHGAVIGALCTGAHILAKAGLITDHRCTIHWENLPGFVEAFPDIDVAADLYEIDRNRFTCSGGTAPLDLMLSRIAAAHGEELATKVSEQCLLDRIRGPHDRQRMPIRIRLGVHHPKLINAIELMEANIEEPLPQEQLAHYIGLSRRQLERLFRRHMGRTPAQYYLELRLERARHLLYQTDLPIMSIACACGFVSASHFSTCYRQMFGRTPRAERNVAA